MLKYKYIFQIKYTEAILSNSTRKLLWFEIKITKILIGLKNKFIVSFIIVFGTLSFTIPTYDTVSWAHTSLDRFIRLRTAQ